MWISASVSTRVESAWRQGPLWPAQPGHVWSHRTARPTGQRCWACRGVGWESLRFGATRAGGEAALERASGGQAAGPAALGPDSSRARVSPNPRAVAWSAPQLTAPWPGDTSACPWRLGACPSRAGFGLQLGASCTVSTVPAPAFPPDAWPRPAPPPAAPHTAVGRAPLPPPFCLLR